MCTDFTPQELGQELITQAAKVCVCVWEATEMSSTHEGNLDKENFLALEWKCYACI